MPDLPIYLIIFLVAFVGSLLFQLSFGILLRKGKQLQKQGKHTEAYRSFENALRWIPPFYHRARATTMMKLGYAAFQAGLLEQSLHWSRGALGENPSPLLIQLAHRQAANALSSMNRYEEAESHLRAVWEYSNKIGNRDQAAHALIQVAALQAKRGCLDQSLDLANQAMASMQKQRQVGYVVLHQTLSSMGRYEEAREALLQARRELGGSHNHHRERQQGIMALGLVDSEVNLRNGDAAAQYLQEAKQYLAHEEKLGYWCEAREAKVLAIQGRTSEAMEKVAQVSSVIDTMANGGAQAQVWPPAPKTEEDSDLNNTKVLLESLGRATFEMRQYQQSKDYWTRLMSQNISPLSQSAALYFLGECHLALGDNSAAREAYQRCVDLNIPSYRARQSWQRLHEMGAIPAPV